MQALLRLMISVLALAWSHAAVAQTEPPAYGDAVDLALAEYEAGNLDAARQHFRRAHALFPSARTLRGIGMVECDLRSYDVCIRFLDDALSSPVRPLEGDLRTETEALLASAYSYVARLTVGLQPEGAIVLVDGLAAVFDQGNRLVLPVGDHVLLFRAEGRMSARRELSVNGGEEMTMTVVLGEQPVAPAIAPVVAPNSAHAPPPSFAASSPARHESTDNQGRFGSAFSPTNEAPPIAEQSPQGNAGRWVVGSVAGASFVGSVVLLAMAIAAKNRVENAPRGTPWPDLKADYERAQLLSGIGFALDGVALVGLIILVYPRSAGTDDTARLAIGPGTASISGNF